MVIERNLTKVKIKAPDEINPELSETKEFPRQGYDGIETFRADKAGQVWLIELTEFKNEGEDEKKRRGWAGVAVGYEYE